MCVCETAEYINLAASAPNGQSRSSEKPRGSLLLYRSLPEKERKKKGKESGDTNRDREKVVREIHSYGGAGLSASTGSSNPQHRQSDQLSHPGTAGPAFSLLNRALAVETGGCPHPHAFPTSVHNFLLFRAQTPFAFGERAVASLFLLPAGPSALV